MIAVKNLQYLSGLLTQEQLIQAVAKHYIPLVSNSEIKTLLSDIVKNSEKNYTDILNYIKSHK